MLTIVELYAGEPKNYDVFNNLNITSVSHDSRGMTIWQTDGKSAIFPIYIEDPVEIERVFNGACSCVWVVIVFQNQIYSVTEKGVNLAEAINKCKEIIAKKRGEK